MDLDNEELKATRKRKTIFDILQEEEKIEKFLDLILNKHYCDDCNNLCSMSETFPLKFVANYIISQRKQIESKKRLIESQKEHIGYLEEYIKELGAKYNVYKFHSGIVCWCVCSSCKSNKQNQ